MFSLEKKHVNKMIKHAKTEYPREACGILAGRNGKVLKVYPMVNTDQSSTTYFMEPNQQFKVVKDIREKGWEMLGIYHSHTDTEAYPSSRDIELAFYPQVLYFIVSLQDFNRPDIKAYRIRDGRIKQQEFEIKEWT